MKTIQVLHTFEYPSTPHLISKYDVFIYLVKYNTQEHGELNLLR